MCGWTHSQIYFKDKSMATDGNEAGFGLLMSHVKACRRRRNKEMHWSVTDLAFQPFSTCVI